MVCLKVDFVCKMLDDESIEGKGIIDYCVDM